MTTLQEAQTARARRWNLEAARAGLRGASRTRYSIYMYLASRVLYLLIAVVGMTLIDTVGSHTALAHAHNWQNHTLDTSSLGTMLSNWDGEWYLKTAETWYSHHVIMHAGSYTTLGFMPLYPMVMWLVAHILPIGYLGAGLAVSMIFGGIATVLIGQIAEEWWGEKVARRAIMFWCFFPGTIVFSMVYSEGLTLTLIAGCMLLLQRKRWLWAGVLAGFATAVAPTNLAAVPMCAAAALLELHSRGWRDREARKSLIAPVLSTLGAVGFGIYLWIWTGSPLSDYRAQHVEWSESSTPLAIPRVIGQVIHQWFISGVGPHGPGGIDLNDILALLGTAFLFFSLKLLWDHRMRVPLTAWVWTLCVCFLALTSAKTPPNPRMLILAFPLVIVIGKALSDRNFRTAMKYNLLITVLASPITYVGMWLRP